MPFIRDGSTPSSSSSEREWSLNDGSTQQQQILSDAAYGARTFPSVGEKALSEQLHPIAVCGMACRLPGDVKSSSDFWELMIRGKTGQSPRVPKSRFNIDAHYHQSNSRPGSFSMLGGYFINETLREFDPSFFNITPVEAMWMDPQQRKLLEVVYESFESAGVSLEQLNGSKTGVFVSSFTADFQQLTFKEPAFRHPFAATGVDPGIISNRISHVFNLNGPSMYINTACSSSVYSLHSACSALRNKECAAAVVGGVNLILTVDQHMNTAKLGVLSPTSTCHTFDASADGYGRAEGIGAVYLKRLDDAIRDGDPIRGLLRSSATNSNGKVPSVGITFPNRDGQVEVIRDAYERGGHLDPKLTGFFECHGTGTPVGDPIEVSAVATAMNENRIDQDGKLMIGAVKTNLGHSEAASGLSAVIKAILIVERGTIPPSRGIKNPNPSIDWEGWKISVPVTPTPFPNLPVKRVSVNSFGYGGTNAHIIVEGSDSVMERRQTYKYYDARQRAFKIPRGVFHRKRPYLLPFTAHDREALQRNIRAHAKSAELYDLLDLSYTLGNKRSRLTSRAYTVASYGTLRETFENLESFAFADAKKQPEVGFIFTGQGAQWPRMGAELMTYYPSFLRTIRALDAVLEELEDAPEWTIEDTLLETAHTSPIHDAEFSQPLCTAIQIALVQLLRAWGVTPKVVVGHSSGEMAAAYAAGYLSASEAIILAFYRGRLVRDINLPGAMLAVGLGADEVMPFLAGYTEKVVVACHNSPSSVTLSGDKPAVEELQKLLSERQIFARLLKTSGKAYHSHHLAGSAGSIYENRVRRALESNVLLDEPITTDATMISTVTNAVVSKDAILDEAYFSTNSREPVLFNQALHTLMALPEFSAVDILVEIGPHSALAGPIRQIKSAAGNTKIEYFATLNRGEDSAASLLKLVGELFLRDYPLDMDRVTSQEEALDNGKIICKRGNFIVDLPPYQWSQRIYTAECRLSLEHRNAKYPRHDILGSLLPGGSLSEPTWRNILRIRDVPWLKDHSLGGEAVFPAAGYFSMAIEAISQIAETSHGNLEISNYLLRDISIKAALVTPEDDNGIEVLTNLRPTVQSVSADESAWWDFNISSIDQSGSKKDHMTGSISVNGITHKPARKTSPHLPQRASGKEWNQALRLVGFDYGNTFADLEDIRFDGKSNHCTGTTLIKDRVDVIEGESRYVIHPSTVDSCLQLMIASIYAGRTKAMTSGAVPIQVDEVLICRPSEAHLANGRGYIYSWIKERGLRNFSGNTQLVANDGDVLMEIDSMRCTLYEAAIPQKHARIAPPMPYGKVTWNLDIDSLPEHTSLDMLSVLGLAAFKEPGLSLLDVGGQFADLIKDQLPSIHYTKVALEDGFEESLKSPFNIVISKSEDIEFAHRAAESCGRLLIENEDGTSIRRAENDVISHMDEKLSIQLLYSNEEASHISLVTSYFEASNCDIITTLITEVEDVLPNVVILDLGSPMLASLTEREFKSIKSTIAKTSRLTWVTAGGLLHGKKPEAGMVAGLLRSIRSEQAAISTVTLDFDLETTSVECLSEAVTNMTLRHIADPELVETEYCVSGNSYYISRLESNDEVNQRANINVDDVIEVSFDPNARMSGEIRSGKLVFDISLEKLCDLDPNGVEIRVSHSVLDKDGVTIIDGSDYPTEVSHQVVGIVSRAGASVASVAVGDRVIAFSFDRFSTFQTTDASLVQKLFECEDPTKVVVIPMAFGAALYGLEYLTKLQKNEVVLILCGTGGVGEAAIQVALLAGAIPIVCVARKEQATFIKETFHLQEDQVMHSDGSITEFLRKTSVDVVFSSGWASNNVVREAWRSIRSFGRFVDCGRKDVLKRDALDITPIRRGASYFSFDMVELYRHKPKVLSQLLNSAIKLYREGKISVTEKTKSFNITEIDTAVSSFGGETGGNGIVIEYSQDDVQPHKIKVKPSLPSVRLRNDASYLLVGCLGGLGRSLTIWMMERGARRFCFLSRSGTDSGEASRLVEELKNAGATVQVVRGDVSIWQDVERAIKGIPKDYPVRGVVQAAMVLRDGLFQNMSYNDWIDSITPKVHGTANLSSVLADTPLDFFLMTSSISGTLGTPGQANYAAANAYMDSLARHRRSNVLNACSAIVPMVLGVGVVAENRELEDSLKHKGMYGIDEEHLLRSLEIAILEQANTKDPLDHLVIGLDPSELRAATKEAGDDVDVFWSRDKRFRALLHHMNGESSAATSGGAAASIVGAMRGAESPQRAQELARAHIVTKLARMLVLDTEAFEDADRSVASYGIDSMVGAELRNWIFREFGVDVPFQRLLAPSMTPDTLAGIMCENVGIEGQS